MTQENAAIDALLTAHADEILREWMTELIDASASVGRRTTANVDTREDAARLLDAVHAGVRQDADTARFDAAAWDGVRNMLEAVTHSRVAQGASASETSRFVLAIKRPLFVRLQQRLTADPQTLVAAIWAISTLADNMAECTMAHYQRLREDIITRQQAELLELSTPVVKLWNGVLAVPMIGTLDSGRTQLVMESLLQRIVETGSELAIIDITGVPTVDTLVAQHLLKTVTAIRLMGADCIISGVRPQIAQTIVHLGIDLQGITTKASLADALQLAMKRLGYVVTKKA